MLSLGRNIMQQARRVESSSVTQQTLRALSGKIHNIHIDNIARPGKGVPKDEMPFYHHRYVPKFHDADHPPRKKHKIPRKRASKLLLDLQTEAVAKNKSERPHVLDVEFWPGDAIELEMVTHGGINSDKTEKVRGVVLGRVNKGLGASVLIRDVLFGDAVNRQIPLHSPLIKSLKVLEKNFIYKGKRKVKRGKLYFLMDRPKKDCQVTK
mmetsp:Transcript_15062/g.23375  ORF Transcript_15062/g.23375 Transcript_15062/m.23375 type:complete len:209 (-) Transcript_15062:76-702(-)|eukprot:CAMPEP_0196814074 /NCGR_PEP_ID=MMETSP1362-20130617/41140_1 /TAXON_ID=163516 /ORGANISM="Leptocylindrus danicus, Strain CCMP1856" /LENGTH=208 /DNA_ID=CAMNT_0042190579 /DNA_START=63 /DNA_END=689 /DNA_ORIENTATION=-